MAKIEGKYEQFWTERLLKKIQEEDSITKRHHLISRYLSQRDKQIEKILANIDKNDIDLTMVIEQLWEDLKLTHKQLLQTMNRNDFYAKYYKLGDYLSTLSIAIKHGYKPNSNALEDFLEQLKAL